MNQNTQLNKAIDDANVVLVRAIIVGLVNQSVEKAKEALELVESRSLDIFVPNDERLYPANFEPSSWDETYWHGLTNDMMHNFSKERCEHMLNVRQHLNRERAIRKEKARRLKTAALIVLGVVAVAIVVVALFSCPQKDSGKPDENKMNTVKSHDQAKPSGSSIPNSTSDKKHSQDNVKNQQKKSTATGHNNPNKEKK